MNKLSALLLALSLTLGCQKLTVTQQQNMPENEIQTAKQTPQLSLEQTFWLALEKQCGSTYRGQSSYPSDPEDSFYGKTLIADFAECSKHEIRVPFTVGNNKSRTWIFSKLDNGKLQLKHQHLHDDGSVDEVSNYGGVSDGGDIQINGDQTNLHVHFPADTFTKQLIPEASTNIWTIELIVDEANNKNSMSYNLYRHSKKRFIAELKRVN